jgi:hypothetical protein
MNEPLLCHRFLLRYHSHPVFSTFTCAVAVEVKNIPKAGFDDEIQDVLFAQAGAI